MSTIIPRFAFRIAVEDDGEHFLEFPKFPEIISAISATEFSGMSAEEVCAYAHDAVICALSARVSTREKVPEGDPDTTICDGFVELDVEEAMKLVLCHVYQDNNFSTIKDFAKRIGKHETAARRLLNFRHKSRPDEIKAAMTQLGKRLHHEWHLDAA